MNKLLQWRKFLFRTCLICFSLGIVYLTQVDSPGSAQSDLNLKSDIISLRARIGRLEQEVNRLRGSQSKPNPRLRTDQPSFVPSTPVNPPVVNGEAIGTSDPFYQRLATLVIELKEDVRNIDQRLNKIEKQTAPQFDQRSEQAPSS